MEKISLHNPSKNSLFNSCVEVYSMEIFPCFHGNFFHGKKLSHKKPIKESFVTLVEVYSMPMLQIVMILIGLTKVNVQDVVLVKVVYSIRGKNQPLKKVLACFPFSDHWGKENFPWKKNFKKLLKYHTVVPLKNVQTNCFELELL